MQKLNSVNSHTELQQRLADNGGSGDGARENGTKHILSSAESVETFQCSSRKMLVGLDIVCLLVEALRHAEAIDHLLGSASLQLFCQDIPFGLAAVHERVFWRNPHPRDMLEYLWPELGQR
ncbi:hypothetical protein DNTS_009006 [Danionella cerebrum]|uniref:Uncharacterized protein n=1 Tax=Danionella cerebrum TaxID=2873325 RepID=A0A553QM86_9TELE|nr:hypothetical protein DNTS_009006 [Danionella translucida]